MLCLDLLPFLQKLGTWLSEDDEAISTVGHFMDDLEKRFIRFIQWL